MLSTVLILIMSIESLNFWEFKFRGGTARKNHDAIMIATYESKTSTESCQVHNNDIYKIMTYKTTTCTNYDVHDRLNLR